jgi:hypothetical protein
MLKIYNIVLFLIIQANGNKQVRNDLWTLLDWHCH